MLHSQAALAAPEECCGLLLGVRGEGGERIEAIRPAANLAATPRVRFEIDPMVLFAAHKAARAGGPQIVGYYHSHPTGKPAPSVTDCEHSTGDCRIWAIVAEGVVAFWRDRAEGFEPVRCREV